MKKIYTFLFLTHDIGFMRFCYIMLIPCALSNEFCRWWMLFMVFIQVLWLHAHSKGWNKDRKSVV